MGSSPSKGSVSYVNGSLRFDKSKQISSDVNISMKRPINISLTPHFTTADKPGNSFLYKLQLNFLNKATHTTEENASSTVSGSLESSMESIGIDCLASQQHFTTIVEFHEIIKRERKVTTVGIIERRTSVVKDNCWTGKANKIEKQDSRLCFAGRLNKITSPSGSNDKNTNKQQDCSLNFDLILCPGELIVPGYSDEWLLIGSFYVNNSSENKSYKWRAAVPRSLNDPD